MNAAPPFRRAAHRAIAPVAALSLVAVAIPLVIHS
jgi:hypothetical protein